MAKNPKIEAHPFDPTKIKNAAEKNVEETIADAFEDAAKEVADDVIEQYELKTAASKIINLLSFKSYDKIPDEIENSLEAVFGEAAEHAIDGVYVHVDEDVKRDDVFDLANEDAKEYAQSRAAEMVGKKWVNGKLVNNPNAQWVITDTTRDGIKSLIEKAYDKGLTPAEVKSELVSSYGFSKERASMIARTEMNRASTQGTLNGWKQTGVVEGKEWILGDDWEDTFECDCGDNADEGVIPLDDDFQSGDNGPPNHPNCNCSLAATLMDEDDMEREEDDE